MQDARHLDRQQQIFGARSVVYLIEYLHYFVKSKTCS